MKILAFAATNSKQSINKKLVTYATQLLKSHVGIDANIEILDLNDFEMPIYSVDRETESGIPNLAKQFYNKIGDADAVIISFAEHNGSYTAAYKNIFDWASRINVKVYQDKPVIALSTSPGSQGGTSVLKSAEESAHFFGANILASQAIGSFDTVFDSTRNELSDSNVRNNLISRLEALKM